MLCWECERLPAAILTVLFVIGTSPTDGTNQSTQPVFRSGVELVEVSAVVTDRAGQPVTGLTADDFEILEDGIRQTIAAFEPVNIPLPFNAPDQSPAAFPLDVATNRGISEGRLFAIILDDLHIEPALTPRVRPQARRFIQQFAGPSDLVMIAPTGGSAGLVQDFTMDKGRLSAVIDRFVGQRPAPGVRSKFEEVYYARVALQIIQRFAEHLLASSRRVALVVLSQGFELHARGEGASSEVSRALREAIAEMTRANLVAYLVDPAGLSLEGTGLVDNLRPLASETGGFAAIALNDLDEAFGRIVRENSVFYILGYYPPRTDRAGRLRRIDVRVPGRDVRVMARKGYVPPATNRRSSQERIPSGVPPRLARVLASPLPVAELPLRAQGIPFRNGRKGRVHVVLEIAGEGLEFTAVNDRFAERVEIAAMTIDARGRRTNGTFTAADFMLTPEERDRIRLTGFRWESMLTLDAGQYQLRMAASSTGSGRVGLVLADVDVPRFESNRLGMSGVVISSLAAPIVLTKGTSRPSPNLPSPPTAVRRFVAGDTVSAGVEVYPPRANARPVTVTARVEAADGQKQLELLETLPSQLRAGEDGVAFHVPTDGWTAGWYVLRVTARLVGQDDSVERVVKFEIM